MGSFAVARGAALCGAAAILSVAGAAAHGVVGARFFPATITVDDPFAADELALPTVTFFDHETDIEAEYSKSILPGFAVSLGLGYDRVAPPGLPSAGGFENVSLAPALEMWRSEAHEAILTTGFIWEIGGSGSPRVADRASSYTPELLFGKGFGDLPDSLALLRPAAVTGQFGLQIPGASGEPNVVQWGAAVEYSLLYLENNVRDVGLEGFTRQLTPIVEFAISTPANADGGASTGTIDPGLIWSGQYTQFAAEAVIPANRASGGAVGFKLQFHVYLDDVFPHSLGHPIFGGTP